MPEEGRGGHQLHSRAWIAFALLAFCLLVLAVLPVLVSLRTRALRATITEVAEPTISAVSRIETAVAAELAALRGYALQGDTSFLGRYRELRAGERREMARLARLAGELDPQIERHARRLASLAAAWHEAVEAALARRPADSAMAGVETLDPAPVRSEARSIRRSVELLERLRRADISEVEAFEIWLNRAMLLLAGVAAISLALLGRRLRALATSSREDRDRLEREVGRRARLVRGISHDLKNPLGVADAHAEFLESGLKGTLNQDQRESVGAIRRSVRHTVRLIDDLLHLARAERGELPLDPIPVDFAALVSEAAADTRSRAEAEDLRLTLSVPPSPVPGVTDPRRVREIVDNLLSNAIRYTPAGGAIASAMTAEEDEGREDGTVRIAVSDTGPGIPAVDQERVFHEFERAADGQDGSGLGLAISREMARMLGGDIHLDSRVGAGSTFTLIVPRQFTAR
ncbi:MAG: CHASE3 domain-containing protein [Gemmatimonadetes bacterium]|nr:CHASE3 domain-containing protein [Gemmatimonadota bacterium]